MQHPPAVKAESEAEVFVAAEPQSNGAAEQQADIIQLTKASSPEHQAADNGGMPNSSEGQILNPVPSGPREAGAMKEAAETRHAVMADAAEAQAADTSSKPSITEDKVLDAVASDTSSAGAIKGEAESVDVVMADAPELQLDLSDSPEDSQKPSSHANHDGTGFKQKVSSQSTVTDSQAVAAPAGQAAGLPHQPSDEKPATKTEELVQVKPQPVTGQEPAVKLSILAQSNESVQVKLTVTTQSADTYAVVPVTTASTAQTAGAVLIAAPPALSGQAVGVQASPVAVTPQLGCPKCRYAQLGCTRCREQLRQMTCPEEATKVLAEAAAASRMTNWLVKRMSVLCTALKQRHQLNDLPQRQQQQAQHVVQVRQPVLDQQQAANAPTLQFSAPTNVVRSTKTAYVAPVDTVKGAPAPVQPLKVQVSGTAQPAQQPWQQTAVQMSHFRQQQRMLQQQQALAEAQKQQQNRLILQQAQRQQGAALLQRQHQAAQQQQLQQQRLMARQQLQAQPRGQTAYTQPQADWAAGTGAAQHAKRQHALLQVQQLQARNQQQMQQQLMQQIAGLQTPQQYGHGM